MGDDLGDEWWDHEGKSDASEPEEETQQEEQPTETPKTEAKPGKRKGVAQNTVKAKKKKKKNEQKECISPPKAETEGEKSDKVKRKRKKKKKTITDVLSASEPKPGCPADLQDMVTKYFSDKLSVVEQDELKLDSCFLTSNDMTHSLSSYLKQVCPKWSKIQKQHTQNSSVVLLIVCSSALRTIELIKQLTTFKGEAKAIKLFAKHIKIEEQVKLLQKGVTHIGVGTPGRISALIEREGLNVQALKYLVLDWNWRDQKLRRMLDIPEIKLDFMKLLESGILSGCKEDRVKIGLF